MTNPLPPGPENAPPAAGVALDRLIAEKVMGWILVNCETDEPAVTQADYLAAAKNDGWSWFGRNGDGYAWEWSPSTSIADAWEVLEKFDNWAISTIATGGHVCQIRIGGVMFSGEAITATRAICLAAIEALSAQEKGAGL